MSDENQPLIVRPDNDLARIGPQPSRIITEMVAGALTQSHSQRQFDCPNEELGGDGLFQEGEAYYYGYNVPQSYVKAAYYYRAAADHGHLDAMCNLGCMLIAGLGGAKNASEAVTFFERASESNHAPALLNLGALYEDDVLTIVGLRKSDPTGSDLCRKIDFLPSNNDSESGVAIFKAMLDLTEVNRLEQASSLITSYEVFSPTINTLTRLAKEGSLCIPILHKVKRSSLNHFQSITGILILNPGDANLLCGEIVNFNVFKAYFEWVCCQGGMPPSGLVCNAKIVSKEKGFTRAISDHLSRSIVGSLNANKVKLNTHGSRFARSCVTVGSLYQRGIGVPQNYSEAMRWYRFAASKGYGSESR